MKPVEHRTTHTFDESLEAIKTAILKAGMTIFADIDHAEAAREHGLSMLETRVLIYGNPVVGTPVMNDTPLAALDLPLRMLVRELPGDRSAIAYHPIAEMFEMLGVKGPDATRFDAAQRKIAEAVGVFRIPAELPK
jgi:uncharacterized protein (DUF302 family)